MLQTLKKHPVFSKHVVQSFCRVNYSKKVCKNFREEEGLSKCGVYVRVCVHAFTHTPPLHLRYTRHSCQQFSRLKTVLGNSLVTNKAEV